MLRNLSIWLTSLCALLASCLLPQNAHSAQPRLCHGRCWKPQPASSFSYQLQGKIRIHVNANVFDVDAIETPRRTIRRMHKNGQRAVCYVSAGSWENWRPDATHYPDSLLGSDLDGWPGERWVDIRDRRLRSLLIRRINICKRKGFDGIEFDNVDSYTQKTGFDLTASDQVKFNRWLANAAHARGLAAGLKNSPAQVKALHRWFDFAVVEQCFQYNECRSYLPFIRARKPVYVAEYHIPLNRFCKQARRLKISAARYTLSLDGRRWPCPKP